MNRKKELLDLVQNNTALVPMIEEMIYLEGELDRLRNLPKIVVHPEDPTKQKTTPAAKLYKELLQQYTNVVRILLRVTGAEELEEESPLRKWMNGRL